MIPMKIPVIFRKFKDEGDIIAIFPTLPGTNDPSTCLSYQHIGQHGSCMGTLTSVTTLAKPSEYQSLLKELRSIGYRDLIIKKKSTHRDYLIRKAEIDRVRKTSSSKTMTRR